MDINQTISVPIYNFSTYIFSFVATNGDGFSDQIDTGIIMMNNGQGKIIHFNEDSSLVTLDIKTNLLNITSRLWLMASVYMLTPYQQS